MQPETFNNHTHESHLALNNIFLCLAESCRNSDFLCEECVFSEHSDHRVIGFSGFAKRTPKMFAETRESLGKMQAELKKRIDQCCSIQNLCAETKKFIKMIEKRISQEKKVLDQKLSETEASMNEIIAFTPDFFEFLTEPEIFTPSEENLKRVSQIRSRLRLSSSFQPELSAVVPDVPAENVFFSEVEQTMRRCSLSLENSFAGDETLGDSLPDYVNKPIYRSNIDLV